MKSGSVSCSSLFLAFMMVIPMASSATPPAHAPAHGYRAKQDAAPTSVEVQKTGIAVVFDSDLGIHIAVGLPGVVFHDGRYYRERDGGWQVSVSGDGGWSVEAGNLVPEVVVKAKKKKTAPPAKAKGRGK